MIELAGAILIALGIRFVIRLIYFWWTGAWDPFYLALGVPPRG